MKKLKCVFIGFGQHAQKYGDVCRHLNIEIKAICVVNPNKYFHIKKKYFIENIYTNHLEILKKEDYDFVMVFLPWNKIEKFIPNIIKNSKTLIFCEKPIALSLNKILKINKLSKIYKRKVFVLYNRRLYKIFNFIKKILKKNKLLKFSMNISEKEQELIKLHSNKIKGSLRYHITSHWIDLIMWLFNLNNLEIKRNKEIYNIKTNKKLDYYNIYLDYLGNRPIEMNFIFKNFRYKLITLEKLYMFKNNKKKIIYNEKKLNRFKPGILNVAKLIKKIVLNKTYKNDLPNTSNLVNLYKNLKYIKK